MEIEEPLFEYIDPNLKYEIICKDSVKYLKN